MITYLTSVNPSANRARFYRVAVEPTLLGDVCVTRSWGRIGGAEQRLAPLPVGDMDTAEMLAGKIVREKLKRGYVAK